MSRRGWGPYLLMVPVLTVALFVGARDGGGPPTTGARVARIAEEVRCPTCEGLSVADSDAPASLEIRREIRRRVAEGETDDEIRSFLVSRYGKDILLKPDTDGVTGLVWVLPVMAVVAAAAGLGLAFRRWRRQGTAEVSEEDRRLVERAVAEQGRSYG